MIETSPAVMTLPGALALIEAEAAERDRTGVGIDRALGLLEQAGVLAWNAVDGLARPPAVEELDMIRSVARADGSVGRVLDGHFNGVERLAVQAPRELAEAELARVRAGLLRVGVWGGDPRSGEGEPAAIQRGAGGAGEPEFLTGVKTFCSGAGSLDRALVLARENGVSLPSAVWIDLRDSKTVEIDEEWYRTSGLRASASHRVIFHRAPILARFGDPGAITVQPWFGRDALRTAASWAGMADRAVAAALGDLARRPGRGQLEELAAGRIVGAQRTIDVWLDAAAAQMDAATSLDAATRLNAPAPPDGLGSPGIQLWDVALHGRVAIAAAARTILDEAARACGSHPFATGGDLDRARRDLDLFLLQHRLDPGVIRAGTAALNAIAEERREP